MDLPVPGVGMCPTLYVNPNYVPVASEEDMVPAYARPLLPIHASSRSVPCLEVTPGCAAPRCRSFGLGFKVYLYGAVADVSGTYK